MLYPLRFLSPPHAEQEAQHVYPSYQQFVKEHDANERCAGDGEVLQPDAAMPLDYVITDAYDNSLVQYVEGQYRFIGIGEEPVYFVQISS